MVIDLSTREGWDIATALRGPDNGHDDLKTISTAVLRHMVSPTFNGGYISYDADYAKYRWNRLSDAGKAAVVAACTYHWSWHIIHGFIAVGTPEAKAHLEWLCSILPFSDRLKQIASEFKPRNF